MIKKETISNAKEHFGKVLEQQANRIERIKNESDFISYKSLDELTIGIIGGDGIGPAITQVGYQVLRNLLHEEISSGRIKFKIIEGPPEFISDQLSEIMRSIPDNFQLHHNYPNPFNPITNISYELSNPSRVTITIYDLKGREVKTIVNEWKQPGYYSTVWNSTDDRNNPVSSGIYFYRMKTNTFHKTLKMLLIK